MLVEIFFFDAGGGHRNAMNALSEVLADVHPEWTVKAVNLQELLESIDPIFDFTKKVVLPLQKLSSHLMVKPIQTQEVYNLALKKGMTRGIGIALSVLQEFVHKKAPLIESLLKQRWQDEKNRRPDLVISVVPNFNGVLFRALKSVHPDVPYITIMTDLMDCPPYFWMEYQDQFLICGTKAAFDQAIGTDFYDPDKVFCASGMLLRKSFYEQPSERSPTREDIGLSPALPTALVMFGGNGSSLSEKIVDRLEKACANVQTIVMCGKNKKLYADLLRKKNCAPIAFTCDVAKYMRLADFFIGKPGPGSLSEALHMGCPVIVECNRSTMPQELPNVNWVLKHGVGIAVKSFSLQIVNAVRYMEQNLDRYKENIKTNLKENRAIYEIADLLEQIADPRTAEFFTYRAAEANFKNERDGTC